MYCPACGSRETGRVGDNEYYCWDCCIEFIITQNGVRQYSIAPDGSLISLESAE